MSVRLIVAVTCALLAACGGEDGPPPPSYHEDLAPLLRDHCLSCHQEGSIAPFPLTTYEEVQSVAPLVVAAVQSRIMPPYLADASGDCRTFSDSHWLSDDEIATFEAWYDGGMREGDPANGPPPPDPPPSLPRVDATVQMAEPYGPDLALEDDYRCFFLETDFASDRYLAGYEVHPGNASIVHHVQLFALDTEAQLEAARALDNAQEGPGYTCFGDSQIDEARALAFWAPGAPPTMYPEGVALKMPAGLPLVVQIHYHTTGTHETDRTSIDLMAVEDSPSMAMMVGIEHKEMVLPPGRDYYETSYDLTVPADVIPIPVRLYAAGPHMHYLGRNLRVELSRGGTGEPTCIMDVPRWDFDWQQLYFYDPPVWIRPGDVVTITCGFDTRSRTEETRWGSGTEDEMCAAYSLLGL